MLAISLIIVGIFFIPSHAASLGSFGHFVINEKVESVHRNQHKVFRRSVTDDVVIEKFRIKSRILSRYSTVDMTSYVTNNANRSNEATVEMRLPKSAFISNFSLIIDSTTYVGIVKEKKAANQQYQQAVSQGQSAAIVKQKPSRFSQTFDVTINVAAGQSVTFHLTYQELLIRKHEFYKQNLYVNPGQVVNDVKIEVHISEPGGIKSIEVTPPLDDTRSKVKSSIELDVEDNLQVRRTHTQAYVLYTPSIEQQNALNGKDLSLTVTYDVSRTELGGDLVLSDGYFVHSFAPDTQFPIIPKDVVFVIDESGSMSGNKIRQTKEAFKTVIDDLKETDRFNVITFASSVKVWKPNKMMEVTPENLRQAKDFVNKIIASGGTNFFAASMKGINLLETNNAKNTLEQASMLIILTDGQPTVGVTDTGTIVSKITEKVEKRYCIFSLGFGKGVDINFLRKLSSQNCGIARQIYEESDAALQLKDFYDEVATPLLAHMLIQYKGMETANITRTTFDNYFKGSEILVAGKIERSSKSSEDNSLEGIIKGRSRDRDIHLVSKSKRFSTTFLEGNNFDMEKFWCYLTIKQLLENKTLTFDDKAAIDAINAKVLELSLKCNFVTPLTSMVVTKPNDTKAFPPPPPPPVYTIDRLPLPRPQPRRYMSALARPYSAPRMLSYATSSRTFGSPSSLGSSYSSRTFFSSHSLGSLLSGSPSFIRQLQQSNVNVPYLLPKFQLGPVRTTTTTTTTTRQPTTTTTTPPPTTTTTTTRQPTTTATAQQTLFIETIYEAFNFTNIETPCSENLTVNEARNISSPRYPGLYPARSKCMWKVELGNDVKENSTLRLSLLGLDIEGNIRCKHDQLLVYPDIDEHTLKHSAKRFCGFTSTKTEVVANSSFTVVFESDNVVQGRGFLLNIDIVNSM